MTKEIQDLQQQIREIDRYLHMLKTPDRSRSTALASPPHSSVMLTLCWQECAGSNNYHETDKCSFNPWLIQAICHQAIPLMQKARELCEAELNKLRVARKSVLEAELAAIAELEKQTP